MRHLPSSRQHLNQMFIWRKRGKISRTVLYYVEYGSCTQNVYTYCDLHEQFLQAMNDWFLAHCDHSTVIRCVCIPSVLLHF